jgi:hypothetical protein
MILNEYQRAMRLFAGDPEERVEKVKLKPVAPSVLAPNFINYVKKHLKTQNL